MFHFQLEVNDKMSRLRAGKAGQHPYLVGNNWQYPRIEERYIQVSSDDLYPFESGGFQLIVGVLPEEILILNRE